MPRFDNRHDWRHFEDRIHRAFNRMGLGPDQHGAPFEHLGDTVRFGRMRAGGDLRLVALYLIEKQPRHGYDLIKAIEEASRGLYSPSPGVIYPALTYLEEAGFVTSAQDGNKKSYTITDEGRAHLAENRATIDNAFDFLGKAGEKVDELRAAWRGQRRAHRPDRDMEGVIAEVNEARRALKEAIADAVAEGAAIQKQMADILQRTAREIRNLRNGTIDI
jgi:DNA-binding PadR family transcriptional regulator